MNISVPVQRVCVSAAGWAASGTARCSRTRWAAGSPCGNAPGGRYSGTLDRGSSPAHTCKNTHTVVLHVTSSPSVRPVPTPQALPVRVRQPAAGGARSLPPYHWEHTDQRPSCSLWPGSLHCRWAGTLPALVLTWGRGREGKRDADIIGVDISELRYERC